MRREQSAARAGSTQSSADAGLSAPPGGEPAPVRVAVGPRIALTATHPLSAVAHDGRVVCVFEVDGEPRAYSGTCLHRGTSLAGGLVRDGTVTCPGHWWRYDLRTGEVTDRPGERLERFPVEQEDGRLVALLPAASSRPASIRERLLEAAREWQARAQAAEAGASADEHGDRA